jgi:outer membrane protein assembly factor BamB
MSKNKVISILFALLLITSMSASIILLPTVNAHTPAWTIISYAFIVAAPNPVGVGQQLAVTMWIDAPLPGATVTNDIRRHDYTLTITEPNGATETQHWDVVSDTTSIQSYLFTPTQVGNYTFSFNYAKQTYTWGSTTVGANTVFTGDIMTAANATTTVNVQQDPIPSALESYPLPTDYWTYPIEGQNTYWYTIASNWLGFPYISGAAVGVGLPGAIQTDGVAPNSPHIMWSKPIQYGGLVGGNNTAVPGEMYYQGGSYNVRFNNPIIMQGTLFYQEPLGNAGSGGDYVAVNLQTGKELWRINVTATGISLVPSFGYLYSYESPNQHGVLPDGLLIATANVAGQGTVWRGYDPRTGVLTTMNITNVPGGTAVAGPSGEYLKYVLTNLGTTANPNWYLAQWNSSDVFGGGAGLSPVNWYSGSLNANVPLTPAMPTSSAGTGNAWNWNGSAWTAVPTAQATSNTPSYDWNISLSTLTGTGWAIGGASSRGLIPLVDRGNLMLLVQGTYGGHPGDYGSIITTDPANVTAISLKPATIGNVLWKQTYPQAPDNNTRMVCGWDPSNGVFVFYDIESMAHYGYSLTTGNQLWGPMFFPREVTSDWNFLALGNDVFAYGKAYYTGYSGILYCYDDLTGNLLWTYGNGGQGNSTNSGLSTAFGNYPTFVSCIADGKVYLEDTVHSPNSPLWKGAQLYCINATNGAEIWTIMDYGNQMYGGVSPVASGYMTVLNTYDSQIYCIGQGPSKLTVTAANPVAQIGTPVVITGTITDVSAGTKQDEQAADFPNGVPCVSDASMSQWMEHVYMQKPEPTNTIGVPISISVIDSNDNHRQIGSTTSDSSGTFGFTWNPDITGQYTIIATFAGSQSYYGSSAETYFNAVASAPTAAPTAEPIQSVADTYFIPAIAGLFVLIIVVAIVLALLMLRKRP